MIYRYVFVSQFYGRFEAFFLAELAGVFNNSVLRTGLFANNRFVLIGVVSEVLILAVDVTAVRHIVSCKALGYAVAVEMLARNGI